MKQRQRGQAMVLASLCLLLLALMVALSFNLSHALRGKTHLQQHSDAMAYSMAILEARTLNYFAVSNRSIAAAYVAMNSTHAYMAASSVTAEMLRAGEKNFNMISVLEFTQGCRKHCAHAFKASRIAKKFRAEAAKYDEKIQKMENAFNKAVKSLDTMVDEIHKSQQAVFDETERALKDGSSNGLSQLKRINAPEANDLVSAVGALNSAELNCAIDGRTCEQSGKPANAPQSSRASILTEVANASRPTWAANRSIFPSYFNPKFIEDLTHNIQGGEGSTVITKHVGTAKTGQGSHLHGGSDSSNDGKASAADEHGTLFSKWKDGAWTTNYSVEIGSDASGGWHTPGGSHGQHHEGFEGTHTRDLMSCSGQGNCFMKFRAISDRKHDFGQPHVYSYITQKLRAGNVRQAPWQLNDKATLKFRHGQMGEATVQLAADEGAGLSKALVYYHRLGAWKEPPNMFNPFWRAKLHPFTPEEAKKVLNQAGNTDAAEMAAIPNLPL